MPACLPDACPPACPGPAPESSFRARSTLQSWEGATASSSWQWKYWEGRLQAGPSAVPTLSGWRRRMRKKRRRNDLGVELAETTPLQALMGLPPLLGFCHGLAVVFPQPQPACRGPAWE